ncbi:helix-turn-helix transcriptional regulator [Promicromonospora iranensis]|uniref:DNA-binding CsgD family transcriptional regulator n=1 Tax=Promicromonospora iranensis TaxID=1105144 RepID=A0ABU2CPC7_9MICO|nr:helix-turn-helix transcriptional regulator [Promicromonospora iranensis]MDR7383131.1 DNA-binding CsgD family transcriptional regulator [Promicromonospora iranensis]
MRRSTTVPLVSRQEQVASLLLAVGRASAGRPGLVLVGGDAGVGKTRLISHVAEAAGQAGASAVVVHCVDLGQVGIPYLAFTDALTQLQTGAAGPDAAARVAELVAERPALWRLLEPGSSGDADHDERLQLFEGIVRSLAVAGEPERPLVLVVEDAHWADASTRDVLRFLAARARSENLLIVVTYRSDDVDRRHPLRPLLAELSRLEHVERMDLQPFDEKELREFTTALAGRPLAAGSFAEVLDRSEGNAFFAEELLDAGPSSAGLPWTLTEVLRTRLERLDPEVQQVLRIASVAGRRVREELLRSAAARWGALDVDTALREAVTQQVLVVSGAHLEFRHALLAEALYADLLPGERSAVHRAYLAVIEQDGPDGMPIGSAAERAHHAFEGHDLPAALSASRDAALRARRLLAPEEELKHWEQVLALWESVPDAEERIGSDRVAVALSAGEAAARAGDPVRAVKLTRRAVDGVDDPVRRAGIQHVLVHRYLDLPTWDETPGQVEAAIADLRAALEILPERSPERIWTNALLARIAMIVDQDDDARVHADCAIEEARATGQSGALAWALSTLAVLDVADPDRASALLDEARTAAAEAGDVLTEMRTLYSGAANRFYAGELEAAEQRVQHALTRAEELGLAWSTPTLNLRILQEVMLYFRGDLAERNSAGVPSTARHVMDATRMYAAVARGDDDVITRGEALLDHWQSDGQIALIGGGSLVDALTWAGRYDDAAALAVRITDHLGEVWTEVFLGRIWLSALAIAALADAAEADRSAGRAGAPGSAAATAVGSRAAARIDSGDSLLAIARETAQRGRPRGGVLGPEGRAWLQRATAENARLHAVVGNVPGSTGTEGEAPAAGELWRTAAAAWQDTVNAFDFGYRYEVARSRYRWAEALLGAGEREAAEVEAAEALSEAQDMGARPLADAVRALARRARLDLPGVRRATASTLTDREEEVLGLVAQGLSNRQIGERLFISTKTVSVHVSNLLAKLGASGRAEAVSLAHQRGLLEV